MYCLKGLFLLVVLDVTAVLCDDYEPVVTLLNRQGKVRGHVLKSNSGKDYYAYQEVPYAAPPVGKNRFIAPKSHTYWAGILNCTRNTKVCMQDLKNTDLNVTEDCLYLNIYSPVKPEDSYYTQLPILIWVHGGGFKSGSGIFQNYGPKYFMDHDVVVVTMNYRLGPFGFLTMQDEHLPANLGVADIGYAVQWVFDNIASFGGDRNAATLVGSGAGAAGTGYVSVGPKIKSQLSSVLQQSGTPISSLYYQSNPKPYSLELGKLLDQDFDSTNSSDLLSLLQDASATDILKASTKMEEAYGDVLIWGPVYDENEDPDDDDSYCPAPPLELFKSGTWIYVTMLGFNSEESSSLAASDDLQALAQQYDDNPLLLVNELWNVNDGNKSIVAEKIKAIYTDHLFSEDLAAFIKYKSDSTLRLPMLKQADLARDYSIPFVYEFAYKGALGKGNQIIEGTESVGHGEEVNYLWDDGTHPDWDDMEESDKLTINRLVTLWVNYITYSDPTPDEENELFQNIKWPSITRYSNITYLVINSTLELREVPSRYEEVREIIDEYSQWPLSVF